MQLTCYAHMVTGLVRRRSILTALIVLVWLLDAMIANKGVTDSDGSSWIEREGQWYWTDDDGETWDESDRPHTERGESGFGSTKG